MQFGILSLSTVSEESDAKGGSSEESKAVSSDLKDEGSSGSNTEDVGEATVESNLNREEAGQKGGRKRKRNKKNTGAWREVNNNAMPCTLGVCLVQYMHPSSICVCSFWYLEF